MDIATDHPQRDINVERWLDELHVHWEFDPEFRLEKIAKRESLNNQSRRIEPVNEEVVERYAEDMRAGDVFPPLIVRKVGYTPIVRGKHITVGGNHRYLACERAEIHRHAAYVIECTDAVATRLGFEDNRRHGYAPSEEDRLQQAVHLIDALGYTRAVSCRIVGVTEPKLNRALGVKKAAQRARDNDIEGFERIGMVAQWRLASIASDPVFTEACVCAIAFEMPGIDIEKMVKDVRATSSDEQAMQVIRDINDHYADIASANAAGVSRVTDLGHLRTALTKLNEVQPQAAVDGCTTYDAMFVTSNRIDAAMAKLNEVRRLLLVGMRNKRRKV